MATYVDYTKSLGRQEGSYTRIRVYSSKVEFWVRSGSAGTWTAAMPYGWTVNGKTGSGTIAYNYPWPGKTYPTPGPWLLVKSFTVNTSQTVTFRIGATGTAGLNGPSEHKQFIQRNTIRVRHNGTWRLGIPYVKSGGQWRQGQAYARHNGTWRVGG